MKTANILLALLALVSSADVTAENNYDQLLSGFKNPPQEARPRVWYHWMNGNVSSEGVEKDLQWMKEAGIGGFHNFDVGFPVQQVVPERLVFMTPGWKSVYSKMTDLVAQYGFEMGISSAPGWSQSGGPWVKPEEAMKKLVWSETIINSDGKVHNYKIADIPSATGAIQNSKMVGLSYSHQSVTPDYSHAEGAVAFRLPDNYKTLAEIGVKITASGGDFDIEKLTDGDIAASMLLPYPEDNSDPWIQYEFDEPQSFCALTVSGGSTRDLFSPDAKAERTLWISADGKEFERVCDIEQSGTFQMTKSFAKTTSKYFRVSFYNPNKDGNAGGWDIMAMYGVGASKPKGIELTELNFFQYPRVNHAEEKAGFAASNSLDSFKTISEMPVLIKSISDVIDISDKIQPDGSLQWKAPKGKWMVMRYGYSLTGQTNNPAVAEASGLEVDKLNKEYVGNYFERYLGMFDSATGGRLGDGGLKYIVTDSYEAGPQNWTPGIADDFCRRRGYSLVQWIPVLTGIVAENALTSEQFLWDWRKTLSELITENYYEQTDKILARHGMARYSESHESIRVYVADGMDVKKNAAVPMSAMWVHENNGTDESPFYMAMSDIKESASVSHIYGQKFVAAESFTATGSEYNAFNYYPAKFKYTTDLELSQGVNRFFIHTSVHQPVDSLMPGQSLFIFGQWFTRHETWASRARALTDYMARSCYMMQQGKFVADIAYYYGEDNNITGLFNQKLPDIPDGYDFDYVSRDAMLNQLEVKDGCLTSKTGMTYKMLVLDENAKNMSYEVLKKISEFAKAGVAICGSMPIQKAGKTGSSKDFDRMVKDIWSGKYSNVYTGISVGDVLSSLGVAPDYIINKSADNSRFRFVHRALPEGDFYWVCNALNREEEVSLSLRVSGKKPMLWQPETGEVRDVSYRMAGNRTEIDLSLNPEESVFVVFMQPAEETQYAVKSAGRNMLCDLSTEWNVRFEPNRGAPEEAFFPTLTDWKDHSDTGIKYFSGKAVYEKTITLADKNPNRRYYLDLGTVSNVATVTVNGKEISTLWKTPYAIEITDALCTGDNKIEIEVINQWVNRIIGDMQPQAEKRYTYTVLPFHNANSQLKSSGLIGPVGLYEEAE